MPLLYSFLPNCRESRFPHSTYSKYVLLSTTSLSKITSSSDGIFLSPAILAHLFTIVGFLKFFHPDFINLIFQKLLLLISMISRFGRFFISLRFTRRFPSRYNSLSSHILANHLLSAILLPLASRISRDSKFSSHAILDSFISAYSSSVLLFISKTFSVLRIFFRFAVSRSMM